MMREQAPHPHPNPLPPEGEGVVSVPSPPEGERVRGRGSAGRRRRGLGFTLLELMVVLAIVAMAMTVVLPAVSAGLRHWRLQASARELVVLFKFARNQAVAKRQPLQVVLERTRSVYWLDRVGSGAAATLDEAEKKGIRLYALGSGVRFGDIVLDGYPANDEQVGLVFSPRGTTAEATVQLLGEGARAYRIRVDPVTGYARAVR